MTNKMTYSVALNAALSTECNLPEEVKARLSDLLTQIEKRNSTENRKPTKAQKQNASLAEVVREVLSGAENPMTITEILHADERLNALTPQKVTAVIYSMGDAVVKVAEKRVNKFRLA